MVLLKMHFIAVYLKHWIVQITLVSFLYILKFMGKNTEYTSINVVNDLIHHHTPRVDNLITNGDINFTPYTNIMYKIHYPKKDNYPNKKILFIGGRNSYFINYRFSQRMCDLLGVKVVSFQYDGYYKSGLSKYVTEETYLKTITEIHDLISKDCEVYIIGYSMGCYGAYLVNKRKDIFLISPFFSFERAVRHAVRFKEFNLNKAMKRKRTDKIHIHTFNHDLITPVSHLDDQFLESNVKMKIHFGNHATGISDLLMDEIKNYINQ